MVFEPMFPRYVFFQPLHLNQSLAPVSSTRGVSHEFRFGQQVAAISLELLDVLRRFEVDRNAVD